MTTLDLIPFTEEWWRQADFSVIASTNFVNYAYKADSRTVWLPDGTQVVVEPIGEITTLGTFRGPDFDSLQDIADYVISERFPPGYTHIVEISPGWYSVYVDDKR